MLGLAIWIAIAVRYWVYLFPETPINPVRHHDSFKIFLVGLGVACLSIMLVLPCFSGIPSFPLVSVSVGAIYIAFVLCVLRIFSHWASHLCENQPEQFPVYVKMAAGSPATGMVYYNNDLLWDLEHEEIGGIYHTRIAYKYRTWNPTLNRWGDNYKSTQWPRADAVNEIWTSTKPTQGADGSINGSCQGTPCLTGKIWMFPNLEFEWTYTNPTTGIMTTKRMSSNEGQWDFKQEYRPLVSLKNNGTEIFRAQSTKTVCSGGDGDIETSLVPLGLMLIAENNYNGIGSDFVES